MRVSRYSALGAYLKKQPPDEMELALSFDQIESILEAPLPRTAKKDRPWWANTKRSNHALKWLRQGWKVGGVDFKKDTVSFVRVKESAALSPKSRTGYDKLNQFLKTVPPQQEQLAMTFSELGETIGQKLPKTAKTDRPWWANTSASPQGKAWLSAGWRLENVYLRAETAVFRRVGGNVLRSISRYVKSILDGPPHVGSPAAHMLSKWIRVCRRVGWYFEGAVLYERGGLSEDAMSELERVEVEEDYDVCKKEITRYKQGEQSVRSAKTDGK